MSEREHRGATIILISAGFFLAVAGWLLASWLAGAPATGGRPLVVSLLWVGCCVLATIWASVSWSRRNRRLQRRLQVLAGSSEASDPATLVERLAADRNRADHALRAFREDFDRLLAALESELEGTGESLWPGPERLGPLEAKVRRLAEDRREDARSISEMLGLWIQELERMQSRTEDVVRSLAADDAGVLGLGGRVTGTGGGREPLKPTDSPGALLSQHLGTVTTELKELQARAKTLRRRLGGQDATELTEDDFVG